MTKRKKLFSVTARDCKWQTMAASTKGGQNANRNRTHVRCTHCASGAVGLGRVHKSQKQNKRLAFVNMSKTKKFEAWWKLEVARKTGALARAEDEANRAMHPDNLRIEVQRDGLWVGE